MIELTPLARPYAKALFASALELKNIDEMALELKIMASAATNIENETNKAKEELRQQMSDIIIDTTQKILGDEISKEKHEDILKKAADNL